MHPEVLGQHVQPDEGLVADVARLVRALWREVVPPLGSEIVVLFNFASVMACLQSGAMNEKENLD